MATEKMAKFRCERCPAIIIIPMKILHQDDNSIKIAKPKECYKEQEGCGRNGKTTDFELIEIFEKELIRNQQTT